MAEKNHRTSSRSPLIQDTFLSCLGSFLAFLLVRWLSEPIYGFTLHFLIYVGCALVLTVIGLLLSGSTRNLSPGASYWAGERLTLTILVKEAGLAVLMFTGKGGFTQPALIVLALVADALFSIALLLYPRLLISKIREEDEILKDLSDRPNALVFGDNEDAARYADQVKKTNRYNLLGLLSRRPEMDRKVIGDYIIYYVPDDEAMDALQWRLGGVDCILFPKGTSGHDGGEGGGESESEAPVRQGKMTAFGRFVKRSFDLVLSGLLLIIFSPLILICAIAVYLEDGSPVIYSQERVGQGGRPFRILKFRSPQVPLNAARRRGDGRPAPLLRRERPAPHARGEVPPAAPP